MSEIHYRSATELKSLLDAREIGARELLDLFPRPGRGAQSGDQRNAVAGCRARAGEADGSDRRRAAGEETGLLDGLPVTVKESSDLAGSPTTWGDPGHRDNIADADSAVVEKYRGAGAVVFGKTNVPFMLSDWQSFNRSTAPAAIRGTSPAPRRLLRRIRGGARRGG